MQKQKHQQNAMATIKYENRLKHKVFCTMSEYLIAKIVLKRQLL